MGIRDLASSTPIKETVPRTTTQRKTRTRKKKSVYDILSDIKADLGISHIPDSEINTKDKLIAVVGKEKYAEKQYLFDLFLRLYRSKTQFQYLIDNYL